MSEPVWYRSLYWRIGFGFIALLAVVLVTQIVIFLWLTDRIVGPSSRSPQQLASTVAAQVGEDLTAQPDLRLDPYLNRKFGHIFQGFVVTLDDGQVGSNRGSSLPPGLLMSFRGRGRRGGGPPGDPGRRDEFGRGGGPGRTREADGREPPPDPDGGAPADAAGSPPSPAGRPADPAAGPDPIAAPPPVDRPEADRPPDGRGIRPPGGPDGRGGRPPGDPDGRGGRRRVETVNAAITVNGTERGTVFVPTESQPVFFAVWEVGPTLAWLALGLLGAGAAVTALLIFRPTHNRLRDLEEAASALGQGQTDVRAVETGGDEVSSLARTFNQMARDLEARATALGESDRARRQLLADVSHELMTPLTAIRGYTETLGMPDLPIDPASRARYLDIIGEETQKLEALIGDLLDLARLEGGGGALLFRQVPAAELFGRITDRHGVTIRERELTVRQRIDPPDLAVQGDAGRLEQALQNLAANALRHTPQGGTVEMSAFAEPDGIHLTVRDSGPGIPPEHLPRVFDRFYKVDASRTAGSGPAGSGLGLSIVQAIVERHGGTVTAANAPEGGAIFEIFLPTAGPS